jgi:membrane fusion protein (multidrug efflux system)
VDAVDVRARMEGFIESRLFDEGQVARKDQDLFLIDPRASQIALDDAKAALASAQTTLADAALFSRCSRMFWVSDFLPTH